jgi:hypothetical protein
MPKLVVFIARYLSLSVLGPKNASLGRKATRNWPLVNDLDTAGPSYPTRSDLIPELSAKKKRIIVLYDVVIYFLPFKFFFCSSF